MKRIFNAMFSLSMLWSLSLPGSCDRTEDYSHIVFRNYLNYGINSATALLNGSVEGTGEGEYRTGSKQAYQQVVDAARTVAEDPGSDQEDVDEAYADLLNAAEVFSDEMVPYRSAFQNWVDYADILLETTQEGEEEGNANPGSKALLQAANSDAKSTVTREDLTQRELDSATVDLTGAIYSFNRSIHGRASAPVKNPSFELPGYETENFGEVEGWTLYGRLESWAPRASISLVEQVPDGQFAARIGSYTQGIFQTTPELINPSASYTLRFKVSLLSNKPDWQGKKFPAILRTRFVVFEEEAGNFDFMTVLSESYDTLGIDPTAFVEKNYPVNIDAISPSIGKPVSVLFEQRHTWNAENPVWAESFIAIDAIRLYRKQ
jgi:hypothetical protein